MQPTVESFDPAVSAMHRPYFSAVRWGAILAGVAAGVSVQLVLTLFGIASGLSINAIAEENTGVAMGAILWAGTSMLIAALIGGYVAARMSGLKRKADGVLHGLVSWAVMTLLFATLAASAGGSFLGGIVNMMGQSAVQGGMLGGTAIAEVLRTNTGRLDMRSLQVLQQHIQAGRRDDAIELLVGALGLDPDAASRAVDQAMIISGAAGNTSPQSMDKADTLAWVLFSAVALSLAIAVAGGVVGVVSSRRITWTGNALTNTA